MAYGKWLNIKSKKYKYVRYMECDNRKFWNANIPGFRWSQYETEREAALAVDRYFINKGKDPVNILTKL